MKHDRLHALTDGIFAIVMTLLVLELKVPVLDSPTNSSLWQALVSDKAVFASYLISFLLLFMYWRAHNFIVSIMAKNLDTNLVNINMAFLFLIGIVPFTTHLLGSYPRTQAAIIVYALNIILIGFSLIIMRRYIERSETIESDQRSREQKLNARIRVLIPMVSSALAIPLSFINTWLAFWLILLSVGFNLLNNAAEIFKKTFRIS